MLRACECVWGDLMAISLLDKRKSLFLFPLFSSLIAGGMEHRD
jgi:hypothetical protein